MECRKCGVPIPPQEKAGPPRKMCEKCSPSRPRRKWKPANPAPVAYLPGAELGPNEATVREQLGAIDRLSSIPGAAALDAAKALDAGALTGAARAALLKEMRAAAAEATRGATVGGGLLDELRKRRERRSS